jgi:predicted ferric reductase/Ca2+-binding EF-hand superfamily protein
MKPKQRNVPKGHRSGFLPLATVFERLSATPPAQGIDAHAVQRALGLRSQYLAQRLLVALGGANRHFHTAEEFVAVAQKMMSASVATKLGFLFRLYDEDGDGWIRRDELERLLHIGLAECNLQLSDYEADKLLVAVMGAADQDGDQRISSAEFMAMMIAHPAIERSLADYGVSLLMPGKRAQKMSLPPGASWSGWVRNGMVLAAWLFIYLGANAIVFAEAFLRYRSLDANIYIQVARACGACLNLNGALIVVPMLRGTLTWIRRSALGRIVPVDDAVGVHRLIGELMLVLSLVHTGAHVLNMWPLLRSGVIPLTRANGTGVALLILLLVIWFFSRKFIRRSGAFELFHISHLAYFPLVALLFVHGPTFWMWGTLPWFWYLIERAVRARRKGGKSRVLYASPLASGVTRLDFERPRNFEYAPGDHLFLCVPAVARHEWHPFTLTSSPEDPHRLTVHIRGLGNWTSAVSKRVPQLLQHGREVIARIDGPYGSASQHILEVPHAIAIAAGIGVTPFASILQTLLLHQAKPDSPRLRLQKLRFVWLNRDQYSFEWFRDLLAELEKHDHQNLLDIHIFMTAGRADMVGSVFDVAQHILRRRQESDIITGLRTHTTLGAPDFDRLLEGFYRSPHLPRPQVFFCGPPPLGRVIARSCRRLGLRFRQERF